MNIPCTCPHCCIHFCHLHYFSAQALKTQVRLVTRVHRAKTTGALAVVVCISFHLALPGAQVSKEEYDRNSSTIFEIQSIPVLYLCNRCKNHLPSIRVGIVA